MGFNAGNFLTADDGAKRRSKVPGNFLDKLVGPEGFEPPTKGL